MFRAFKGAKSRISWKQKALVMAGMVFCSGSAWIVCTRPTKDPLSKSLVKAAYEAHDASIPKFPVVLLNGVLGINKMGRFEYFRNIPTILKAKGIHVVLPLVPPTGTIEARARSVKSAVDTALKETKATKVHIIAHSMGGLDGRYYISKVGGSDHVLSLVTIATPHHGAAFADYAYEHLGDNNARMIENFMSAVGVKLDAFRELTTTHLKSFNNECPNAQNVEYFSYGAAKKNQQDVSIVFQFPYYVTHNMDGENDGIVSVSTSKWGTYMRTLNAGHLEQIGWETGPMAPPYFWRKKSFDPPDFFTHEILPLLVSVERGDRSSRRAR